ncbi:MAG: hypothetical protein KJ626_11745 [Verrucomicrobia bacterium]|nr:hypothetical protein [Verrucomicrobiota bacterium]
MKRLLGILLGISLLFCATVQAQDVNGPALRPGDYFVPGETETPWLLYKDSAAKNVEICGSWSEWSGRHALKPKDNAWYIDTRDLHLPEGWYKYKFIVNGVWEEGDNRKLFINERGTLERPPDLIVSATHDGANVVNVAFRKPIPKSVAEKVNVTFTPDLAIEKLDFDAPSVQRFLQGHILTGGRITFYFSEDLYGLDLDQKSEVVVAGSFNGWGASDARPRWRLRDDDNDGIWELTTQALGLRPSAGESELLYKFIVDDQWQNPPPGAPNAVDDGQGNTNLKIDPKASGSVALQIVTKEPLDPSVAYDVAVEGVWRRPLHSYVNPGHYLDQLYSDKELGVILDKEEGATTYRLFAPRASMVWLNIYDGPYYEVEINGRRERVKPVERYEMWRDRDGVWEMSLLGLDIGKYYDFNVDGPQGEGENFYPQAHVGDPYAKAAAHAENNCLVIDDDVTNRWFHGWTDQAYVTRPPEEVVIYEAHVRDLTMDPSSGVSDQLRGTYEGILATEGTGTGLDHLTELGINTIEFLPLGEFNNGIDDHNWGYSTAYYFSPEASYGLQPLKGSSHYEFKNLVNELHKRNLGVIMDVVYNHVGWPNHWSLIDKKYYFRLNPDYSYMNFSGCGNDVRTEAPMMRRMIIDNIVYLMKEFHIDGFRFDLAELIDLDTMMQIRDAARAINPDVMLISEPWSFRGEHKYQLTGTGWSAWNNDFRYAAKDFATGGRNRDWLKKQITGSVDTWAANPLQPVNYVESHDDMALVDEFSTRPDRNGHHLQKWEADATKLAATILFTSMGIPMIAEGQEFLRSKYGIHNSYDKGDPVNALRWDERDKPLAKNAFEYYKGLITLRNSPQGAAFRVTTKPPKNYYQWLEPQNEQTLGYIVNSPKIHSGSGFIVLLNCGATQTRMSMSFPKGKWTMIGDGEQIDVNGLQHTHPITGPIHATVRVPAKSAIILMNDQDPN